MREIGHFLSRGDGSRRPKPGPLAPTLFALAWLATLSGCGDQSHEESLPVLQVGMTKAVAPIYDDGELLIYEVKKGIAFPILAPSDQARGALNERQVEPYGRQ